MFPSPIPMATSNYFVCRYVVWAYVGELRQLCRCLFVIWDRMQRRICDGKRTSSLFTATYGLCCRTWHSTNCVIPRVCRVAANWYIRWIEIVMFYGAMLLILTQVGMNKVWGVFESIENYLSFPIYVCRDYHSLRRGLSTADSWL